ncbi:hypothetical protein ACQP10_38140 (plasmid) [Streptosporangium sandarakinum]|uniref:hypothetical protein n=1 Tax=Streptosporangium sandarakinum TaxID=1260955 RepID=UPI003D92742B
MAVIAGGPAIVAAGQGGNADLGALGLAGGQAALAAVLAYFHHRVRPAGGPNLSEAPVRAGRSWWQNLVSAVVVAGGAAVVSAGGDDLKTLGLAAGQAGLAALIAYGYNVVAPRKGDGEDLGGGGGSSAGSGAGGHSIV